VEKSNARWSVVAIASVAAICAAVAVPLAAGATPDLPEKSAEEVLALVAESQGAAFSGTLLQTSDLGLPEIPSVAGDSGDELQSGLELLTGSHEARVFAGGEDRIRVQILDELAERDVIRNGDDVWFYDSAVNEATHLVLSEHDAPTPTSIPTPAEIADGLLDAVEPSTEVSVESHARVAGRDAYVLSLVPRTDQTLVAAVTLSVDAETGLPLSVEVSARGQDDPAFAVAFTQIDFSAPDPALFDFSAPATAEVTEKLAPTTDSAHSSYPDDSAPAPVVTGTGWNSVITVSSPAASAGDPADGNGDEADYTALLSQLTSPVAGGRAIQTSLMSILLTDDGRVLVGAVPTERLLAVAGQ